MAYIVGSTRNDVGTLRLRGTSDRDTLDGGPGADEMEGGWGNDLYIVDNVNDVVIESFGQGYDTVRTSVSYTLPAGAEIERLEAAPGTSWLSLTGNGFKNTIIGNDGMNVLDGGGGADRMEGRGGNDVYYVDNVDDVVIEYAGQGIDTVRTSVNFYYRGEVYDSESKVEIIETTNAAGTDPLTLEGNLSDNTITGNNGDNRIDGYYGADTMIGKGGNDTYIVYDADDVVLESAGGGTLDRVQTEVSWTMTNGSEVEVLETTSYRMARAINLTGNEFNNTINGNDGVNVLNGAGGADTMTGFGGDDTYVVDNAFDVVIEAAGQGANDRVQTSVSYTLAAGAEIEVLETSNAASTAAVNLTGNEFRNTLNGNNGANTLNGGGNGDTMSGFGGNDTYIVDNFFDAVIDAVGNGTNDRVQTSASFVLTAGSEIEVLETTNSAGTASMTLYGNEFANTIVGNDGANIIAGSSDTDNGGYDGKDFMSGRGGADTFMWSSTDETRLAGQEADVVTDFNRAQGDLLDFSRIDANVTNDLNGFVNDQFQFIGVVSVQPDNSFNFTGAGQIGYFSTGTDTYVLLNTDGDNFQEATIHLLGGHTVQQSWFVL